MRIKQLVQLVTDAVGGKDNFKEGAVGSNGYGFVFRDLKSNVSYITNTNSHKYCEAGSNRDVIKILKKVKNFEDLRDLSNFNEKSDLPGMRIYVIECEYEREGKNKYFGNAKRILQIYNVIVKS